MIWTKEKLEALSFDDRSRLYANALKLETPDAKALVALIQGSGLMIAEPGWLKADSPITQAIEAVVRSKAGIEGALKAANEGLPALTGVEPLLVEALGDEYAGLNHATLEAGFRVGAVMQERGWRHGGKVKMPLGSVAKTAELWIK